MKNLIEKVKQGMQYCIDSRCCPEHCPYYDDPDGCAKASSTDVLSVIDYMEQEIERLKENIDTLLPVLHGEWEEKEYSIGKCYAICSLCKKSSMGYAKDTGFGFEYSFPNYCPHCGAKMKDGENKRKGRGE